MSKIRVVGEKTEGCCCPAQPLRPVRAFRQFGLPLLIDNPNLGDQLVGFLEKRSQRMRPAAQLLFLRFSRERVLVGKQIEAHVRFPRQRIFRCRFEFFQELRRHFEQPARGPLRRVGARWLSMRWTVLAPSITLVDFLALAHARSAREWMDAMRSFDAPAQNMLVADRGGHIAIRSTGAFPLRPGDGRGDEIRDGTTSASDWTGWWPLAKGMCLTGFWEPLSNAGDLSPMASSIWREPALPAASRWVWC